MTDDPKDLWQQQPSNGDEMDVEALRTGVQIQLARVRRARILLLMVALVGTTLTAYQAASAPMGLLRLGQGLLAGGFLLFLALGWRRLTVDSPHASEACVVFLRKSLARRRDAARGGWIVLAAPLMPGLGVTLAALVVASATKWLQVAPIAALLVLWFAIMVVMQAREASNVARELKELDKQTRG